MRRALSVKADSAREIEAMSLQRRVVRIVLITLIGAWFLCCGKVRADTEPPPPFTPPEEAPRLLPPSNWTPEGTYDQVVAVVDEGELRCTGVLVAPDVILTARHCLPASHVHVGARADQPRQRREVVRTTGHPELRFDIALLFLDQPLPAPPLRLRPTTQSRSPLGKVTLIGYGATSTYGQGGEGRKRFTEVALAGWGCDGLRMRTTGCDPQIEMVIPRSGGRDTCSGDSGAPVLETLPGRGERVLAIVSRGLPSVRQACGQGGIYVRADQIAAWLTSVIPTKQEGR